MTTNSGREALRAVAVELNRATGELLRREMRKAQARWWKQKKAALQQAAEAVARFIR